MKSVSFFGVHAADGDAPPTFFFFLTVEPPIKSSLPSPLTFCSRTEVGKNPWPLMRWMASSLEPASMVPFCGLPAEFSAS